MNLSLKGFSQLIEDMSAALQSSATTLIDVSVGSVVRAIFEANASVALWIQWLILQVLQTTRASTSTGSDLDSWMQDFGLSRLPAAASTGIVTFSRYAANLAATIPVGSVIKTGDGSLSFKVAEDNKSSIWQPDSSAYVIPGGVANADLPVTCDSSGSSGNVLSGTISVIAASLPGIDQVNNTNPLANGADAETDQAFRNRFQGYLASRSRATLGAVQNAIAGVRQGLKFAIEQNTGLSGSTQIGAFLVVVDDGSGYPSSDLLSNVASAVDSVRPVGATFAVMAPQVLPVNVSLTVSFAAPEDVTAGIARIQSYIAAYLNGLPIGGAASVTRIAQHAYQAGPQVMNIGDIQLNATSADVPTPPFGVIKAGQVVVLTNDG
jgi:uncharacterized phage protein gp47/JayE